MRRSARCGIICCTRRMVDAQHREAVERHVLHELLEAGDHRLGRAPVVEMLGVHVGDDRDDRGQAEEAAVAFVGLHHHPVAGAEARVGAVGVDDAAVDDGGIEPRGFQHRGDQAGRGGLAVGAADGDRPAQAHQFGQHFRAPHHRDQPRARGGAPRGCRASPRWRRPRPAPAPRLARLVARWRRAMPASRRRFTLALSAMSLPCTE